MVERRYYPLNGMVDFRARSLKKSLSAEKRVVKEGEPKYFEAIVVRRMGHCTLKIHKHVVVLTKKFCNLQTMHNNSLSRKTLLAPRKLCTKSVLIVDCSKDPQLFLVWSRKAAASVHKLHLLLHSDGDCMRKRASRDATSTYWLTPRFKTE